MDGGHSNSSKECSFRTLVWKIAVRVERRSEMQLKWLPSEHCRQLRVKVSGERVSQTEKDGKCVTSAEVSPLTNMSKTVF